MKHLGLFTAFLSWVGCKTTTPIPVMADTLVPGSVPTMQSPRSVTYATGGMVAAAHPQAVHIGVDVLRKGGTAIDAAIAVNVALGVMEPGMNGLGGDLFAIVWDNKTKRLYGLNASGRSPLALTIDKVKPNADGTIPMTQPVAWSVPGAVDGWFALHERFGKVPMSELMQPAIEAAGNGVVVPAVIAKEWLFGTWFDGIKNAPGFAETFMIDGRAPREGDLFRNPELAKTLRAIAEGGRDAFYKGEIAQAIVAYSQKHGGFFSMEDFERNHSDWVEPIKTTFAGAEIWELPPNGQGLVVLQMLNILENFDLESIGRESPLYWHILIEAKKIAFEDRARYYADPEFAKLPIAELLSKEHARDLAGRIDLKHAAQRYATTPALDRGDTTYITAGDADGNMVSLIQSNYMPFGTGHTVKGFALQNRGSMFSLNKDHPNSLQPGKRPFNTIIPAFVTRHGEPWLSFGVMGGPMQPQGHVQILAALLLFGDNLQQAGERARFEHTGSSEPMGTLMKTSGEVRLEPGFSKKIREGLEALGHELAPEGTGYFGGYQAIARDSKTGIYAGATETRKDGIALGVPR